MAHDKPRPTELIARGLVVVGGAVLLCQNRKHGYSYLPGGHMDPGESAAEALAREFLEETTLRVRVGRCVAATEEAFQQGGDFRREINLVFHVELPHETSTPGTSAPGPSTPPIVTSAEPKIAFAWLRGSELASADLRPASHKRLVIREAASEGQTGCADPEGFSKVLWASHLP